MSVAAIGVDIGAAAIALFFIDYLISIKRDIFYSLYYCYLLCLLFFRFELDTDYLALIIWLWLFGADF